ncbi:heterokaryon incompatibility protein [Fusarium heterosporum]|uniref:Heterokaryon incompatibility protein n=1 Tax=Fusarium heterosporum TaxID=42747 RepID=A0A8H5TW45_FUSHE|nr:heterokaryon incompatibility protein [Fusarium heterosporum]
MAFIHDYLVRDNVTVRLVRLPELSDANSRLSLELQHASIKTTRYAALSYVWGDMKNPVSVSINGMPFLIGTNLHSALRQLRKNSIRDWLWVDSLCIQQTNSDEKSYQVNQMGIIFSSAEDYWHRIWIYQEVALAKDVVVLCGTQSVSLAIFMATFHAVDICNRLKLQADYGLSTEEVFTSATWAMINESIPNDPVAFTLDRCVPRTGNMEPLHTWVPDWRKIGEKCNTAYAINYGGAFDATRGVETFSYVGCPGEDAQGILRRKGCYVDTITEVLRPSYKEAYERIEAFIPLGEESGSAEDYVWRTIHAQDWYDTINPRTHQSILCLVRQVMRQQAMNMKHLTEEQAEFLDTLGSITYRDVNTADGRLEMGSKGMLGMGHDVIESGDIVSLIWGVKSPIVLQPVDGCQRQGHTFKGDAYVDGIMHGEFLKTDPARRDFVIY